MSYVAKPVERERFLKRIKGIQKHFAGVASVIINGVPVAPARLADLYQRRLDASQETARAHAAWITCVRQEREAVRALHPLDVGFVQYLHMLYGRQATLLADFALEPRKIGRKTVATKLAAADKMRATRKARRTMGKKQKAKIKG